MSVWVAVDAVCQLLLRAKRPAVVWVFRREWFSRSECAGRRFNGWCRWPTSRTRLVELDFKLIDD